MKKVFLLFLLNLILGLGSAVFAKGNLSVSAYYVQVPSSEYKQENVTSKYKVYNLFIHNKSKEPVLISSNSELFFVLRDGTVFKSETRRQLYRNVKQNEMKTYRYLALPGMFLAGVIKWCTFTLGDSLGVGLKLAATAPTEKIVKKNHKVSQELFSINSLPPKLESDSQYNVMILVPLNFDIEEMIITNVSFNLVNMYELRIGERN